MMTADSFDDLALRVLPGSGLVHRGPGSILVVPDLKPAHADVAGLVIGHCRSTVDPTGRRLFRRVVGVLADADPDSVPGLCLLIESLGDVVLLAQGPVVVEASVGGKTHHLRGSDSLAWVEQRFAGTVGKIVVASEGAAAESPSSAIAFDLRSGTVPGGGAVVTAGGPLPEALEPDEAGTPEAVPHQASAPEPEATRPPQVEEPVATAGDGSRSTDTADLVLAQVAEAPSDSEASSNGAPSQVFESVLLMDVGTEEERAPLPVTAEPAMDTPEAEGGHAPAESLVEGALCSRGHFNDPSSAYCSVCGISMLQRTRDTVLRPRPSLGVLVVDDGSAYTITSPYVLGRSPESDESVTSGRSRALVLDDETHSVSRVHATVTLDGWKVLLTDCGSSNGTYVSGNGEDGTWTALVPDEPTALGPRTHVRVGKRRLVFDSYHAKAAAP